jgi:hypothetical protein
MENVKSVMEGVYDVHPAADGICCPNRGFSFYNIKYLFFYCFLAFTCIQPKREADGGAASPAGVRPRWWYNAVTGEKIGNCHRKDKITFLFKKYSNLRAGL